MKTVIERNFFNSINTQPQLQCHENLKLPWPSPRSSPLAFLLRVICLQTLTTRIQSARPAILAGLVALVSVSKRHLVGYVLLAVGVIQIFAYQLFFSEAPRDHSWIYLNWYYYFFANRQFLLLIWWSSSFLLFVPTKYSLSFIPFSLVQSVGWIGLIHNSFFVQVNEDFHRFPHWSALVMGLAFGFGVIMSLDYAAYWWNHKALGNWTKFVGVAEMNASPAEKEPLYTQLAKDFRAIQKTI